MTLMVSARLQVTILRVITKSDLQLPRCGAAGGEFAYNVSLRDDARDPLIRADKDQCANATCRQQLDSGRKIGGGLNREYALRLTIVANHASLLSRIALTVMVASAGDAASTIF